MPRLFILPFLFLCLCSCTENDSVKDKSKLRNEDANAAHSNAQVNPNGVGVQFFTQLPSDLDKCSGLFLIDTSERIKQYVFASDLKGKGFLMMNNKMVHLDLIKQTNVDKKTLNELYTKDDLEVELKITQIKELASNAWNYNGVLVVRKEGREEAINITGKMGCP